MFRWRAEKSRQCPALWFKREGRFRFISWKEFNDRVEETALSLHHLGIRKGDKVGEIHIVDAVGVLLTVCDLVAQEEVQGTYLFLLKRFFYEIFR